MSLHPSPFTDTARIEWIEAIARDPKGDVLKISTFSGGETHVVLGTRNLSIGKSLREALDRAIDYIDSIPDEFMGRTSCPACNGSGCNHCIPDEFTG